MTTKLRLTPGRLETLAGIAAGYDHDGDSGSYGSGSREYNQRRDYLLTKSLVVARGNRLWLTGAGIRELGRALEKRIGRP